MPTVKAEELESLGQRIFAAAGAPADVASFMAHSLVVGNLMGHDSHGVIRIPRYVQQINERQLKPAAKPEIIKETETTALVGGNWTFGQVSTKFATELAIAKARKANVAAVGVTQLNHVGRVGQFAEMIASAGMFGMVVVGFHKEGKSVAPYGGTGRMFGTNPWALAVPAGKRPMIVLDFASSILAEGKLQVARAKKAELPPGVIFDKEGHPSTNVEDFYAGGVLMPFGLHKGSGLSMFATLFPILIGADVFGQPTRATGTFIIAVNIEAFRPLEDFRREVDALIAEIKAVPPAPGVDEVLVAGEPEQRNIADRTANGIYVPDETWRQLNVTAEKLSVAVPAVAVRAH